ncbi:hypothetical protein M2132_000580 [Dysgonomonas sp. PH5-45]|uniref:DUF3078 domain-containing protein n=1 Tax=unclassified Dysgonomonas TaxID=2630389 RepID=UPI002473FB33|nr:MULTISPECIES: DUF3078 domain-containing protein [unclassified Dysgonomonas]MDH6354253.1 hypothetical protein [Dysgonomonas sp. PH5-45]MDH6387154.1 hypothetical protein [Dysgonomonas sp. PH5-37]
MKNIHSIITVTLVLFFLAFNVSAQNTSRTFLNDNVSVSQSKDNLYENTLPVLQRGSNGLIIMPGGGWTPFSDRITFKDTMLIEAFMLPVVFDGKILSPDLSFTTNTNTNQTTPIFRLIHPDSTFVPLLSKRDKINEIRRSYYMSHPDKVKYNAFSFGKTNAEKEKEAAKTSVFKDVLPTEDPTIAPPPTDIDKYVPKIIYWTKTGEHALSIAQNYISDNWYKGGSNNFYVKNYHKFTLNYERKKIKFRNVWEWKLDLQKEEADTVHSIRITDDLFRMENTLEVAAFKKWSYSAKLETKTQLFNRFPINSKAKSTTLFSPLYSNLGFGMSYTHNSTSKKNKHRTFSLTQNIAPIAVNLTYVGSDDVDETSFGLDEGKKTKWEFGSTINTDMSISFSQNAKLTSRFKYFTNYHRAEVELENRFDMALNRFLSTSIHIYARFDDNEGAKRDGDWGYLQRYESISFGLSYKW